ncbi:MAG: VWA domain-containing protein [Nanoarchaeota archaeon]|nr:VWA domain-containing protein [Nanoarchaeota archaeon]
MFALPMDLELLYPERLWLIPILLLILLFFTLKTYVPINETNPNALKRAKKRRKAARAMMFLSRSLMIIALVIAIASPSMTITKKVSGSPSLNILVDRSRSTEVFDLDFVDGLNTRLGEQLATSLTEIGKGIKPRVGSDILANLEENGNLLLITDGHTDYGAEFNDVMTYANALNCSVSAVQLNPIRAETAIRVEGPTKVVSGLETSFNVLLSNTKSSNVHVEVQVDDQTVLVEDTEGNELEFTKTFEEGTHQIIAKITNEDHFSENNIFYKTVRVVEKPEIFLVGSDNSPMGQVLNELYDIKRGSALPEDLSGYYAIVLDNVADLDTKGLDSFLDDGNGLLAVGGKDSYEFAQYSEMMRFLPVIPGLGNIEAKPDLNAVVIVDISSKDERAVAKAFAIDILDQFKPNDNVGLVAFAQEAFVMSQMSRMFQKDVPELKDELRKLGYRCSLNNRYVCSRFDLAFDLAIKQFRGVRGRKYIFLLSDGMFGPSNRDPPWTLINTLNEDNIQVIPVVTIPVTKDLLSRFQDVDNLVVYKSGYNFMKSISDKTSQDEYGGTIIKPTPKALPQIAIITGKRQLDAEEGDEDKGLFVFDTSHFITKGVELSARLFGSNQVVPKSNGKLLVSTADGFPILIVGYYGLGRVASLATDNGQSWSPELFADKENSELVSRTMNWAIGDPERKKESYVMITDGRIGGKVTVMVKSPAPPDADNIVFEKNGATYTGTVWPSEVGVHELLGQKFSVNHDIELAYLGMRPDMYELVSRTGGKIFKADSPGEIVEHVKEMANRRIREKSELRWPFIAFVLCLLLIEIITRRIVEYRNAR